MRRLKSAPKSPKGEHGAPKGSEFGCKAVEFDLAGAENTDAKSEAKSDFGFNMCFSTALLVPWGSGPDVP